MKKLRNIFGMFLIIALFFSFADFHSSMTKVDYNSSNGALRFTTKMNNTDLQKALNMASGSANFDNAARKYVAEHFSASVNGTPLRLTFTGSQAIGDSFRVYFESAGVKNIQTISITNNILLNNFPSQINIVNIDYNGTQRTLTFRRGKESQSVSF